MQLQAHDGFIRIKVIPKSSKNELVEIMEDEQGKIYKIRLKAVPEKGKANQELIKFIAKTLTIPAQEIKIISGKTDKIKLLKITS